MYKMLDLEEKSLHPKEGVLLITGITWGYRDSIQMFAMTALWEFLYRIKRRKVGGCRPQYLHPYLGAKGWRIKKLIRTMSTGYPWMTSVVISARPPFTSKNRAPPKIQSRKSRRHRRTLCVGYKQKMLPTYFHDRKITLLSFI